MNIVSKHTAIVALAAALGLHAFVVPTSAAELMNNTVLEEADPAIKKPSSKQNARQRDSESGQLQRRESRGREQSPVTVRSRDERRQRDDGQPRFARPSRERGGALQADAARSNRVGRSRGTETAMNAQDGSMSQEELLRLERQKGKGDRRERPAGEHREIRRTEGEPQGRNRSGSAMNAQEGIVPPNEVLQSDPQRQDRSRTETNGSKRDPSGTNRDGVRFGTSGGDDSKRGDRRDGDNFRFGTSGSDDSKRGEHRPGDGKGRHDGDGIRFGTSGGDDSKRGEHRSDGGRDRRDGDGIRFGTSAGDDSKRGEHRSDGGRDRRDGDNFRFGTSRGDDDRRHDVRRHNGDHNRRHVVKHVIHHIPSRHAVVLHGRDRYHYHSGRFYRPWEGGFILVRPPLGLIVLSIPLGSRMIFSAGIPYHVFGDVYYRRVPTGYEVVEPIRDRASNWPDQVTVVTDLLNVRYGPDESEEVIAQVERYAVLNVLGSAPGWLYVEIEDEDVRGWVMERYVVAGAGRG